MYSRILLSLLFGVLGALSAVAQESPAGVPLGVSDEVLARQGDIVLTQGEIDAAFARIPEVHRLAYIRSGDQVDALIRNLLQNKVVAAEARKEGYEKNPLVEKRMALTGEKELAEAWMAHVIANAPDADYEALAYEAYVADPEQWMSKPYLDVSHLLISSQNKPDAEALESIQSLRVELDADPGRFDELILEYSEDPSKDLNQGRFPKMYRGQMVKPFEDAAFAIQAPGDITQPVQTSYGYHLIRLNQKYPSEVLPFDTIREDAIEKARQKHLSQYRANYLRNLLSEPIKLEDGAVEAMVKRYFGENLELAPVFED
jgi:peptidyl-prolyl cis-trans isomerase C